MNRSNRAFYTWLGLAVFYALVTFLAPADKVTTAKYHLSPLAIHWINFTVIVPVVIILYLAYVGYANLKEYYISIEHNSDGQAFKYLAWGVGVFAYGTLITSTLTTIFKWIAIDNGSFTANSIRLSNYLGVIIPLLAFWYIAEGGRRLIQVGKLKYSNMAVRSMILLVAILGGTYSFITFHNDTLVGHTIAGTNPYYMPPWLVLLTIVIPYIFAWALGLLGVMQLLAYRQKIKGLLYREAINVVTAGLGIVLLSFIGVEYLTSLSNRLAIIRLGWLLAIVYVLLLVIALGFLSVAVGSKRLKRIEEV